MKNKCINILAIGVGGCPGLSGGESLHMWKAYFRKGRILGIDICDKSQFSEDRIDIQQCDRTDAEALTRLSNEYGGFDIVIDNGSHLNEHVIKSFEILFPLMHLDGIYGFEDTQTAYWPTWGGGACNPRSSMAFFKRLADGLNYAEYPVKDYQPTYFDRNIVEIAFFHNLVLIRKGNNGEKTNVPDLIERELEASGNSAEPLRTLEWNVRTGGSQPLSYVRPALEL